MRAGDRFGALVRAVARRPLAVLGAVGVLCLVAAAFAFRLEPSASTDTLISSSTDSFKATERFKQEFGDDPVIVFVKGDLEKTILTADLGRLIRLEGCLSGNVPKEGLAALPKVCRELADLKPAKVVYGPGTFVNTAADQILTGFQARQGQTAAEGKAAADAARKAAAKQGLPPADQERLAKQAEDLANRKFVEDALKLALRYGLTSIPSVDNPEFVAQLVLDPGGRECAPKARFAYLFPSCQGALIQVRLRPNLTDAERTRAITLIREATALDDPACRERAKRQKAGSRSGQRGQGGSGSGAEASAAKACDFKLEGGARYVVSGVPVVVAGLASAVQDAIFVLLAAALLVMGATLAVVFRTRLRLLPLTLALGAASLTFGALSLAGGELTMASIAVLPVLIGLAVDYAIQFQARFDERRRAGDEPSPAEAATDAARLGGPTIATAGIATAAGFLVLLLSPVPMVKGFGLLLVIGIVLALGCALTAGFAALVRFSDPRARAEGVPPLAPRTRAFFAGIGDRVVTSRPWEELARFAGRVWGWVAYRAERAFRGALDRPRRALAIGLLIAVCGWALDTQTEVVSDVRELVPQDLQALKDVNQLQSATGVSGEIDVVVRAKDVTDPKVVAWMARFQAQVLKDHGYKPGATCAQRKDPPELCPALSLPDLFSSGGGRETQESIRGLLNAVPPYFSQGVVSAPKQDGSRRIANLAFGIRLGSLERQQEVIEDIKSRLDPPPGVDASVAGLPVLAAQANDSLSSPGRRALTLLAGLALVFFVLLAIRRRLRDAAVPLIPIALATGWSALLLFLLRIPLNPMSVTLGALVIAISTEFSVLLSARYSQERAEGAEPRAAIERAYASTGAAVLASGATAIAGFAALIVSDIRMLQDFGISTVVDLTVSLLGVMVVLPAALIWAEEHGRFTLRDLDPRPLLRELWQVFRAGFGALRRAPAAIAAIVRLRVRRGS